eukprot:2815464-Prymnesium_polylepis.1
MSGCAQRGARASTTGRAGAAAKPLTAESESRATSARSCIAKLLRKGSPRSRGPPTQRDGRWPMMSPEAVSGRYARPA